MSKQIRRERISEVSNKELAKLLMVAHDRLAGNEPVFPGNLADIKFAAQRLAATPETVKQAPAIKLKLASNGCTERILIRQWDNVGNLGPGEYDLYTLPQHQTPQIPLNDETKWILGRICFTCVPVAQALRAMGQDVPKKAELEQAHAIHWMLNQYLEHGEKWREEAGKILQAATVDKKNSEAEQP